MKTITGISLLILLGLGIFGYHYLAIWIYYHEDIIVDGVALLTLCGALVWAAVASGDAPSAPSSVEYADEPADRPTQQPSWVDSGREPTTATIDGKAA